MMNKEQQLSDILEQQYDNECQKIFDHIVEMGANSFTRNNPLFKYRDTDILDRLIQHFEEKEEYEKCSKIQKIQWCLRGIR